MVDTVTDLATTPAPPRRKPIGGGDVAIGLAITVAVSAVISTIYVLASTDILDQLDSGALPSDITIPAEGILLAFLAGWSGLAGWPIIASRRKGTGSLAADYGLTAPTVSDLKAGALIGVAALAMNLGAGVIADLLLGGSSGNTAVFPLDDTSGILLVLLVFGIAVGAPVTEELFFRGLTVRAFQRKWGNRAAIGGSTLLFALLHFGNLDDSGAAFETFVATGTGGLLFAWAAIRRKSITASIIAHSIVNSTVVALILFGIE